MGFDAFGFRDVRVPSFACHVVRVLLDQRFERFGVVLLEGVQSGFYALGPLSQFGKLAPVFLIGRVDFVTLFTQPDELFHDALLPEHVAELHDFRGSQNDGHGVVVGGGDRIELVIVAARAAKGQPEKGLAEGVELFVGDFHTLAFGIVADQHLGANDEKAGRDSLAVALVD